MPKTYMINESDLGELERILPQLAEAATLALNNRLRVQIRRCKTILSNIRWNYGPAGEIEIVPAEDTDPD